MGSRFGGLKQITPIAKSGESIIDFSVYDAIRAGFKKVIIVVRPEIEKDFHTFFGTRLENHVHLQYAHQSLNNDILPHRKKPLGTAQAVLVAKKFIDGPFSVINADDFYGLESFQKAAQFLQSDFPNDKHAVIGYELGKTLSEYGPVSRAECRVDENKHLIGIHELLQVYHEEDSVYYNLKGSKYSISGKTLVSMNFWCFQPSIFQYLESDFQSFIKKLPENPESEFLIPDVVNKMIRNNTCTFEVIPTKSLWFGITYKNDFEVISKGISELTNTDLYSSPLWN